MLLPPDDDAANSAPSSDEETRTAWGRKAKDFYDERSDEESSEDEEELQERAAEAVRVTEVEEMEGVREEHFGADPRSIEALKKLLDMQGKSLQQQQKGADKKAAEGTEQEMLWQARLDAVSRWPCARIHCLTENHRKAEQVKYISWLEP